MDDLGVSRIGIAGDGARYPSQPPCVQDLDLESGATGVGQNRLGDRVVPDSEHAHLVAAAPQSVREIDGVDLSAAERQSCQTDRDAHRIVAFGGCHLDLRELREDHLAASRSTVETCSCWSTVRCGNIGSDRMRSAAASATGNRPRR